MAPFGNPNSNSVEFELFAARLPPLPSSKPAVESSLFDEMERMCFPAFIDEEPGNYLQMNLLEDPEPTSNQEEQEQPEAAENAPTFAEILAASQAAKNTRCMHCGVTESPQWRRGPPNKPLLCNACGTRFRRTNQLGAPVPPASRKRTTHQDCGISEMAKGRSLKQPRMVA